MNRISTLFALVSLSLSLVACGGLYGQAPAVQDQSAAPVTGADLLEQGSQQNPDETRKTLNHPCHAASSAVEDYFEDYCLNPKNGERYTETQLILMGRAAATKCRTGKGRKLGCRSEYMECKRFQYNAEHKGIHVRNDGKVWESPNRTCENKAPGETD